MENDKLFNKAVSPEEEAAAAANLAEHGAAPPLAVSPVDFKVVETPNAKIEWARRDDDYVYHFHPKRPPTLGVEDTQLLIIAAVDPIMPRETHVHFDMPVPEMRMNFYTIRIADIADKPGAKEACEVKMLEVLAGLQLWAPPPAKRR
jgi:hypothetical protein